MVGRRGAADENRYRGRDGNNNGKEKKKKKGRERERAWIIDCRNGNQHVTDAPSNTKLTDK